MTHIISLQILLKFFQIESKRPFLYEQIEIALIENALLSINKTDTPYII